MLYRTKSIKNSINLPSLILRFGEAGVFAKTYIPTLLETTFKAWKKHLLNTNKKLLHQRLANPMDYTSQFPELVDLLKCGKIVNQWLESLSLPAHCVSVFHGILLSTLLSDEATLHYLPFIKITF